MIKTSERHLRRQPLRYAIAIAFAPGHDVDRVSRRLSPLFLHGTSLCPWAACFRLRSPSEHWLHVFERGRRRCGRRRAWLAPAGHPAAKHDWTRTLLARLLSLPETVVSVDIDVRVSIVAAIARRDGPSGLASDLVYSRRGSCGHRTAGGATPRCVGYGANRRPDQLPYHLPRQRSCRKLRKSRVPVDEPSLPKGQTWDRMVRRPGASTLFRMSADCTGVGKG